MNALRIATIFAIATNTLVAQTANLAPSGTATSSSTGFGGSPELANDGNRDGIFVNASVFHSAGATGPGEWYEVDLGSEFFLDRILIFPRTDQAQNSVRDFTLEIFDASDVLVWTSDFLPEASTGDAPWGTASMSGQKGQRVRLTLKSPNFSAVNFLTFAEFEIWGSPNQLPLNIAPTATLSSSTPGFGAAIENGIDQDLAGNFFANTEEGGPVFHDDTSAGQGFYRLAFESPTTFNEVQLYNRVLGATATTTLAYRISILDGGDNLLTSREVTAEGTNYDHILDFGGVTGNTLLLEELDEAQFLAFSEIRILSGAPSALPVPAITDLEVNSQTGEVTISARVKPNTGYFLYSSPDLENWLNISDDIFSATDSATFTYIPAGDSEKLFFYLEEIALAR